MRRKVHGTVSGIYMYSAALRERPKRRTRVCDTALRPTKRVFRVFAVGAIRLNPRSITPLASMRASARRGLSDYLQRQSDNESMGAYSAYVVNPGAAGTLD